MKIWGLVLLAIGFNVLAQFLMKLNGTSSQRTFFEIIFSSTSVAACFLYGLSFILGLVIYKYNELSVIAPVMSSLTSLFVVVVGCFFFHEVMTVPKLIGILCIIIGLIFINR